MDQQARRQSIDRGDAGGRPGSPRLEISRRRLLGLGAALATGTALRGFLPPGRIGEAGLADSFVPSLGPTSDPTQLVEPEVRASSRGLLETTLRARVAPVHVAGQAANLWVYEGLYPGPTLRIRPGDTLKVKLDNGLDGNTNLHVHGFHVSPSNNSDNVLLQIDPGKTFDYQYDVPRDHPSGLYWYHPHFHGDSNEQVFQGMAGAIIIEGELDRLPGVAGLPERLLILQATELGDDGNVLPVDQRNQAKFLRLVNGQLNPTITIRPGETQRWRILNASATTFYNLQLDGHPFHQIAADGNTLGEVWTRETIVMAPGERVEVLIQGGQAGTYSFKTLAFDMGQTVEPEVVMATLVSDGPAETPASLPTKLIPFTDLSTATVDNHREVHFQVLPNKVFQIDGKEFDENRVDQSVQLGATEEWTIFNDSDVWHPFHIHINPFQVVAINGQTVPVRSFEDTIPLPPHGSVTMRSRFLDYTGKYVYHCHILTHEDGGMMGIVEVVDPRVGPTTDSTPHHPTHHR